MDFHSAITTVVSLPTTAGTSMNQDRSDDVPSPSSMGIKEIRQELESLGVSMVGIFEKNELIDELVNARTKRKVHPLSKGIKEFRQELGSLGVSRVSQGGMPRSSPIAIDAVP